MTEAFNFNHDTLQHKQQHL